MERFVDAKHINVFVPNQELFQFCYSKQGIINLIHSPALEAENRIRELVDEFLSFHL